MVIVAVSFAHLPGMRCSDSCCFDAKGVSVSAMSSAPADTSLN